MKDLALPLAVFVGLGAVMAIGRRNLAADPRVDNPRSPGRRAKAIYIYPSQAAILGSAVRVQMTRVTGARRKQLAGILHRLREHAGAEDSWAFILEPPEAMLIATALKREWPSLDSSDRKAVRRAYDRLVDYANTPTSLVGAMAGTIVAQRLPGQPQPAGMMSWY